MKYYTVKEASQIIGISERRLYDYIKKIEDCTRYKFGYNFCGYHFLGKPVKQRVISDFELCEIIKLVNLVTLQKFTLKKAIKQIF